MVKESLKIFFCVRRERVRKIVTVPPSHHDEEDSHNVKDTTYQFRPAVSSVFRK